MKSLALASKPQVLSLGLENCPVLGSRTALFFELLKFRWKTPETSRKICEHLFCFPQLEYRRRQGEGGRLPFPNCNFTNDKNVTKKPIVSSVSFQHFSLTTVQLIYNIEDQGRRVPLNSIFASQFKRMTYWQRGQMGKGVVFTTTLIAGS